MLTFIQLYNSNKTEIKFVVLALRTMGVTLLYIVLGSVILNVAQGFEIPNDLARGAIEYEFWNTHKDNVTARWSDLRAWNNTKRWEHCYAYHTSHFQEILKNRKIVLNVLPKIRRMKISISFSTLVAKILGFSDKVIIKVDVLQCPMANLPWISKRDGAPVTPMNYYLNLKVGGNCLLEIREREEMEHKEHDRALVEVRVNGYHLVDEHCWSVDNNELKMTREAEVSKLVQLKQEEKAELKQLEEDEFGLGEDSFYDGLSRADGPGEINREVFEEYDGSDHEIFWFDPPKKKEIITQIIPVEEYRDTKKVQPTRDKVIFGVKEEKQIQELILEDDSVYFGVEMGKKKKPVSKCESVCGDTEEKQEQKLILGEDFADNKELEERDQRMPMPVFDSKETLGLDDLTFLEDDFYYRGKVPANKPPLTEEMILKKLEDGDFSFSEDDHFDLGNFH